MKKIKINFIGFPNNMSVKDNLIVEILSKYFIVEICDNPDYYFICTTYLNNEVKRQAGIFNSYCSLPQVRILLEGENFVPDFNLVDYAISSYPINFLDRHFYMPCGVESFYTTKFGQFLQLPVSKRIFTEKDLNEKVYFANFIASHDSENNLRGDFFKQLSKYKRIESLGRLYNNSNISVSWRDGSKVSFQKKCKFTLCFESTKDEGFITEKIVDAFYANTIPIYYGSSTIISIFNPNAFINCSAFDSFDDAIDEIISIDQDDEKYMKMMRESIFLDDQFPRKLMGDLESFLQNIFVQDHENAYRRSRVYAPKYFENFIRRAELELSKKVEEEHRIVARKAKVLNAIYKFFPKRLTQKLHSLYRAYKRYK